LETVLAKGIRVNQLAKELGVPSKLILDKCRDEGLGEKVSNHMAVLSVGLAETVREWFHAGAAGGGTAVETAAPVEVAVKPKTRKKKVAAADEVAADVSETVVSPDAPHVEESSVAEESRKHVSRTRKPPAEHVSPVAKAAPPADEAPAAPVVAPEPPAAPVVSESPVKPDIETPAAPPPAVHEPAPEIPAPTVAAEAPAAQPPAAAAPHGPGRTPPHARPTITLANRNVPPAAERKPVTPAPKLVAPKPAELRGPRLVREEKPDIVPAPRPRGPRAPAANDAPSFTQARPQAGRGVKVSEDDDDSDSKKKAAGKGARSLSSRRRGPDGRRGEAMEKLKEYTEADLIERRDRLNAAASYRTGFDSHLKKSSERGHHVQAKTAVQRGGAIEIEEPITVKNLSAALGIKSNDLMGKLMKQGTFATINQSLSRDLAETLAMEYGIELRIAEERTLDEELEHEFEQRSASSENLISRPPVVTILGHVDHGKTSLLDKIRSANVAAGESGGITQHTAAWMVEVGEGDKKKRVTFIDTPGHQAFTSMRARGANMTDVVVLVVAAVEGVMPQTIESINHARAAGVPIVVAMNKIDRPDANPDMVLGQLAGQNLNPVEWGGDTEVIRTSATTGQGIQELIEILDYQSELLELKTHADMPARGIVIESRVDPGMGVVATVLIQDGKLKLGDVGLCGPGFGRIRQIQNDRGENIEQATASMPVIISGLSQIPSAGEKFYVVDDLDRARAIAEERATQSRQAQLNQLNRVTTLENLLATMSAADVQTINLIIKADVQGSLETLVKTVTGQNTEEVKVRVIHSGVGAISESDVHLAMATKTKATDNRVAIIGFHVVPEDAARVLAEQNHIDVKLYRVIYEIFDDLKKALSGMLTPEEREKLHGHVEIRQVFKVSRLGNIAGCMVTDGHVQRGSKIRLIRDGVVITQDLTMESLKRLKDDVREVKSGLECGIKLAGYDDIKVGDVLEAYIRETFQRTL
jgi:translation initiation factor IF-2